jgi:signal transduction histidine kinase/CheY-like chemotaxis protein
MLVRSLPGMGVALLDKQLRYIVADGPGLVQSPAELVGRTIDEAWPPDKAALLREIYQGALDGETQNTTYEYRGKTYGLYAQPITLDDGSQAVMAVAQDITERQQAEEQRRQMERKLQETQRLEGLGVLAGGIAHDFNNLLGGILGHAQLALMDLPPGGEAYESITAIAAIARSAAELTSQLLAYAGKGRVVVQPLQLNTLVHEMRDLLQVSVARHCTVVYDCAEHLPAIEADSAQLRQVVLNLLVNASEAIAPGSGTIRLDTSVEWLDKQQLARLVLGDGLAEGSYVRLTVADDGVGMDEATLSWMFEPFFSTKFAGRGLGLAAVLGIVRAHHGALQVRSKPGEGTTFCVWFPAIGASVQPAEQSQPAPFVRHSGAVLVIDDDEQVRRITARFLERMGFSVFSAPDGLTGLQLLRTGIPSLAAVLVDLTMPQLSGDVVARLVGELAPGTPVVLMSGYSASEIAAQHANLGVAAFVQKPFGFDTLQHVLASACPSLTE